MDDAYEQTIEAGVYANGDNIMQVLKPVGPEVATYGYILHSIEVGGYHRIGGFDVLEEINRSMYTPSLV
jgi:hypothetical protein